MTRESALSDALQEWFDRAELVHHLKAPPYGEELLRQLPHPLRGNSVAERLRGLTPQ